MSPDPWGMVDGPNLYIYLNNNPLNDIDSWGMCRGGGLPWWAPTPDRILRWSGRFLSSFGFTGIGRLAGALGVAIQPGGWGQAAGTVIGGVLGSNAGGIVGTVIAPGAGTVIGSIVGGILGGTVGGMAGAYFD